MAKSVQPLSPRETLEILASLGMRPRKSWGQNFLIDPNTVRKSIEMADIHTGEAVVEVGPGLGTLTGALLNAGARIFAIELDPRLADWLRERYGSLETFQLLQGDAVQYPLAGLPTPHPAPFKIISNLPYAITSPWLERVIDHSALPSKMVLLVQREAADRLTASPGSKAVGALTIFLDAAFQRRPGRPVSRSCFYPTPAVDSVLLHLERRETPIYFSLPARQVIRAFFTRRRKQVGNLARECLPPDAATAWLDSLRNHSCSPSSRPEELPFAAWHNIQNLLETHR